MMKVKEQLVHNQSTIFSKIANLQIFYANTVDLVSDFLLD